MPTTPKEFYTDLDLKENNVLNGHTPDVEESDPETVLINKGYVNLQSLYSTELSTEKQTADIGAGGISAGDQVDGRTIKALFDNLFYPLKPSVYLLPQLSFTANQSGTKETGSIYDVLLTSSFTPRDSDGLRTATPYSYEGAGISGVVDSGVNTYTITNYTTTVGTNSWIGRVKYLESTVIKNDSHGTPDPSGQFPDGVLTASRSITGVWPHFAQVLDGDIASPVDGAELRARGGKNVASIPAEFTLVVPAGGSKTVFLAIPSTSKVLEVIKDGALPITASFIKQANMTISDVNSTGQTKEYTIWRHTNGVGYTVNSEYLVKYK